LRPEEIQSLEEQKTHLIQWLESYKAAKDIIPYVQNMLEITEWKIQALKALPPRVSTAIPTDLIPQFDREHSYLTNVLPVMPRYNPDAVQNSFALMTSGASSAYAYILTIGHQGTMEYQDYSKKYISLYNTLQTSQNRPESIRALLDKLGSKATLQKFDRASQAFSTMKSGVGERTAAALEIRTLLDEIQGFLFEKARKQEKETITWNEMPKRLAKGVYAGHQYQGLITQGARRSALIDTLSRIAKDREGKLLNNMEDIWTQTLDHIFIVLGLIKS
jgi:hypothetical protein